MNTNNFLQENNMDTKVEHLDRQHIILFKLIKKLKTILSLGEPDYNETIEVLAELSAYSTYHFKTEEKFLKEHGYTHLDLHKAKHDAFFEQIESFKLENMLGTPGLGKEMLDYLEKWLRIHIQHLDISACKQISSKEAQKSDCND